MVATQERMELRVVAYREGDYYIAQGLEFDICVQAKTIEELQDRFDLAAFATLAICAERGTDPYEGIPRAPSEFWEMFENAHALPTRIAHARSGVVGRGEVSAPALQWRELPAA